MMKKIAKKGYSNVLVYDQTQTKIIGFIKAKQLLDKIDCTLTDKVLNSCKIL